MENLKMFSGLLLALITGFFCFYAGWRVRQAIGASRLNDAFTDIGGGSFSELINAFLSRVIWTILALASGVATYYLLGYSLALYNSSHAGVVTQPQMTDKINIVEKNENKSEVQNNENKSEVQNNLKDTQIEEIVPNKNQELKKDESSYITREQIEALEKEKGYSGDDPIIRERLGLPPKK